MAAAVAYTSFSHSPVPPVIRRKAVAEPENNPSTARPQPSTAPQRQRAVDLLDALSPEARGEFQQLQQTAHYPKGARLYLEGQPARGIYIVHSGHVKNVASSAEGRSIILGLELVGPGEIIGLSNIITNTPLATSAETQTVAEISFIERADFLRFIAAHPRVLSAIAEVLSRELRDAWAQTRLLALDHRTETKLAQWLLGCVDRHGRQIRDGFAIRMTMTREEIGETLGMSRETVSRVFSEFKRRGIVRVLSTAALVVQPEPLRQICGC